MRAVILAMVLAGGAAAQPTFTANNCTANAWTGCSVTGVTAGNLIVVSSFWVSGSNFPGPNPTLTDASGDTATILSGANCTPGTVLCQGLAIIQASHAGTHALTVASAGWAPACCGKTQAFELSGQFANTNAAWQQIDAIAAATGAGSGPATVSFTTHSNNQTAYVFCATDNGPTLGSGYTLLSNANGPLSEYRTLATAGAYTATCPLGSPSDNWIIQVVTFRVAGDGALSVNEVRSVYNTASVDGANSAVTTLACTITGVTAGDSIVLAGAHMPSISSVTDSAANTVSTCSTCDVGSGADTASVRYISGATAGSHTITWNFAAPGGAAPPHCRLVEVSGAVTVDASASAAATASSATAQATVTTLKANDFLFTWGAAANASHEANSQVDVFNGPTASYYYTGSAGSYTGAITKNVTPDDWVVQVVAFAPSTTTTSRGYVFIL